jgi:hypothetical protein
LNEKEEQLYNAMFELWPIRELAPEKLYILKEIDYGMFQPRQKTKIPDLFL